MDQSQSVETLADDFFQQLPCASKNPYPSTETSFKNKQVAKMLLDAFGGGDSAEFTAIAQYLQHSHTIEKKEIADQIFCIALIEMRHLDLLGNLIVSLGGEDLRYWAANESYWDGGSVHYGTSMCEKLSLDIVSEQNAINTYNGLIRNIDQLHDPQLRQVTALLRRIREDEITHLETFKRLYSMYCENDSMPSSTATMRRNSYQNRMF